MLASGGHGRPERACQTLPMSEVFSFPRLVNDKAARVVAAGVLTMCALTLALGWYWLLAIVAAGFLLRVLAGPSLSPLALLATKVVAPRLGAPRYLPGPPKRFAQGIGLVLTGTAAVLSLAFGSYVAADVLLVATIAAASLESVLGLCVGCQLFALLMRVGVIPERICEECADLSRLIRPGATSG
jgi:hypothetical protein